jgi:hypothetical protein
MYRGKFLNFWHLYLQIFPSHCLLEIYDSVTITASQHAYESCSMYNVTLG